jgi:hypothetical protein
MSDPTTAELLRKLHEAIPGAVHHPLMPAAGKAAMLALQALAVRLAQRLDELEAAARAAA